MRRKLIKQRESYTITLPIKWIKKLNLAKESEIDILETKDGLLLKVDSKPVKKEATVSLSLKHSRFIRKILLNYYNAGYDKLVFSSEIPEKDFYKELEFVPGFSVSSKDKGRFVVDAVSETEEKNVPNLMKQLFFIAHQNMLEVVKSIKEKKHPDIEFIRINSERAVRNSSMCLRTINKRMKQFDGFLWALINGVIWIDRQTYYLAEEISTKKPIEIKKLCIEYINSVVESFDSLYNGIYTNSINEFEKIQHNYEKYEKEKHKIIPNQPQYIALILNSFSQISYLIFRLSGDGMGFVSLVKTDLS